MARTASKKTAHKPIASPATPPEQSLGFLLPRVAHSLMREFEEMLGSYGIRSTHLGVLSTIRAYGPLPQGRISQYLGLERQTLVNVTDDLAQLQLIERRPDTADRRLQILHLTPAGETFHDRVDAEAEAHQQRIFGVLSVEEQRSLEVILKKLAPSGYFETLFNPPQVRSEAE